MRNLFLITLLFICCHGYAYPEPINMNKVRSLFKEAATDEKACKAMLAILEKVDENKPLLLGYKASATMMMANYVGSPFSKLSYFKKGKQMLELAVGKDKRDVELRLLRYLVQKSAPSFLGYHSHLEEDKAFISNNIAGIKDLDKKNFVIKTLNDSKK